MDRIALAIALLAAPLTSCAAASDASAKPLPAEEAAPAGGTLVLDRTAADRLLRADGVTLQWIGWDDRGPISVREEGGTIFVTGGQVDPQGGGELNLDGQVREIGTGYFLFDGTIRITDAPDLGRFCEADKVWHFAITQNRRYWRLREFEWCDELTDYIDIYF